MNFSGQTALVTGATRGIGKAISLALLEQGARVIGIYGGNDRAAQLFQEEQRARKEQLELHHCDVSDEEAVRALYHMLESRYESLEILVNNAGIRRDGLLATMNSASWQRVMDVNLTGTFFMCRHAVLFMLKNKYGRIVNISSPTSRLGFAGQANYAASKAGQVALTKTLAKETAKKKITVNCVSPGFIATDLIADLPAEQVKEYKKLVPMKRFGTVEEVADAVLFLAGKNASYITGTVLEVSGGL